MNDNKRAERIIQQKVIDDVQSRLDTYFKYLYGTTTRDPDRAKEAREKICDWAVSDLVLLLRERDSLINSLKDAEKLLFDIQSRPNCNDCGITKTCKYRPMWGNPVRYGCPLWENAQPNTTS